MEKTNENNSMVNCFNEWDKLEEVIVGIADESMVPTWHSYMGPVLPEKQHDFFKENAGKPFNHELIRNANHELDMFAQLLESRGIVVRRPTNYGFAKPYTTPDWKEDNSLYAAMPRDLLLVVGNEIIECPMSWRSRYHEVNAYRPLLKEYFASGCKWSSAPKPQLTDELYQENFVPGKKGERFKSCLTEFEPTFDAADFVRCGKDIFGQLSHVTNQSGFDWLERHLGDEYRLHQLEFDDQHAMHIDTTFMPLAPGKLLVHPDKIRTLPKQFKDWDIITAPTPCFPDSYPLHFSSKWISMNIFMIDENIAIVEQDEKSIQDTLMQHGIDVITTPFKNFNALGGSFHCATLDIRRRGKLQSYFN
ncbi:hypothetical protein RND59_19590 [Vibrio ruber]|uniref:hypothetical protein n=1 Tax=Vibrio ruber TaxID=184755 RepID=UPI00289355CB|nr:hypothetical protein [Vibrio ruber]WNJ97405.1 hypothetical protein RND59_19590 [Vibrio ruber]